MNRPSRRYALDCASPLALSQPGARAKKRQRTAAVQDAIATATASSRFKVPMHAQKRKQAVPRHPDSRDPSSVALQRRVDALSTLSINRGQYVASNEFKFCEAKLHFFATQERKNSSYSDTSSISAAEGRARRPNLNSGTRSRLANTISATLAQPRVSTPSTETR